MRFAQAGLAAFVAAIAFCLPAQAAENKQGTPYELVRSLRELQEQAGRGNPATPQAQSALMTLISQRIAASGPELWRDRRNVLAVITYLLSGGAAQALRAQPEPGLLSKADETLLRGAYTYALGRGAEAGEILAEIDPRTLPASLGGHVAFVRASLSGRDNPAGAIALLDLARLLAPGTLVEEAALRREVFALGSMGDFDKFIQLSRQYLTRFPRSIYSDNFLEGFAGSLMQLEIGEDPARFARLDEVIAPLSIEVKRELYLQVARVALVKGRTGAARFAAEKAEAMTAPGSLERSRAALYVAAGLVVTDQYDRAVSHLDSIAQAPFATSDAELRDAVAGIARRLRQWPESGAAKPGQGAPAPAAGGASGKLAKSAATIELAQAALASSEGLLRGKTP